MQVGKWQDDIIRFEDHCDAQLEYGLLVLAFGEEVDGLLKTHVGTGFGHGVVFGAGGGFAAKLLADVPEILGGRVIIIVVVV